MSTGPTRARRHSPAVYRRRRLLVLIIAVAVVAVLIWLIFAPPWRSSAAPAPSATPSPVASASATASAEPSPQPESSASAEVGATEGVTNAEGAEESGEEAVAACDAQDVLVQAVTDKDSYAADQQPKLSIRLTNRSGQDCTLNVGTSQQIFTVTSGDDTWWRSTDCQSEPSDQVVTLTAGQEVESASPVTWDRTRSSVSTCDGDREAAPGGGASYHVAVSIGGIASEDSKQILLY